ncbi:MAG: hypothetical protein SNJ69_01555 [Chloroflexaceae bacterium]
MPWTNVKTTTALQVVVVLPDVRLMHVRRAGGSNLVMTTQRLAGRERLLPYHSSV